LKLKGEIPTLAEPKVDPAMLKKSEDGTVIEAPKVVKAPACEIDASLQKRIVEGSITSTVAQEKAGADKIFELR